MTLVSGSSLGATDARPDHDPDYDLLLAKLQQRVDGLTGPLFTVEIADVDLYNACFVGSLPPELRQHNTCHACRNFVNRYGRLVQIGPDGSLISALWHEDDAPGVYREAVKQLRLAVEAGPIGGVFYTSESTWGQPVTGPWRHLAAVSPAALVFKHSLQTAGQATAEKREDYRTISRALSDFTPAILNTAVALLKSEALYRSEKVLGVAEWLQALHTKRKNLRNTLLCENATWLAVATAPAGYCHPRSSMIGTLLEDIAAGMSGNEVKRRFDAKMHPLQYQRPQAAPKAGNIAQAEKIVEQLKAAGALRRRYARIDEVQTLWRPRPQPTLPAGGVFGHLQPKKAGKRRDTNLVVPSAKRITWGRFAREVLPTAEALSFLVPSGHTSYGALVTAVDPTAPPIVQWDTESERNPFSWYQYAHGSSPIAWGLKPVEYRQIAAVVPLPFMWHGEYAHHGAGVMLVLEDAKDQNAASVGACLFPEVLKAEFRAIRATIEAFSNSARMEGAEDASVCGLILQKGSDWSNIVVRVVTEGLTMDYALDRWE